MAKCEEGYLCDVCGQDVGEITDSDLYLRYVIGEVDPEQLHVLKERHISCNPVLAQFITDPRFTTRNSLEIPAGFAKQALDPAWVGAREELVTRGWQRLCEMSQAAAAIVDYPLPEVRSKW